MSQKLTDLEKSYIREAEKIQDEEGGDIFQILRTRFNLNLNPYAHYYGWDKPLD